MPDKRYSLKVNGQNRTVKADVFNDNIDKFVNDMPDATIKMYKGVAGQDGYEEREYRMRDISDAYDAGFSFAETDTPIYVNTKALETPSNSQQDDGVNRSDGFNGQNETASYEEAQTVEQPIEQAPEVPRSWRDEPLNIGTGGDAGSVKASTYGDVYDTLSLFFGNARATAQPGDKTAYDQTWQKAIEMGIEDDDQFSKTRKLVGTINREWAGRLAKGAVERIMDNMPDRTSDVMGDLAPLYYDKDLQQELFHDAANMGNDYTDYVNMFVKPQLKEALRQKYGFSDSDLSGVTGLFSNWEHVKNRQEVGEVAELLGQHFTTAIDAAFKEADQFANDVIKDHNESISPYSDPGMDFGAVFAVREGNERRDPEKILKYLPYVVGTSMNEMLEDGQLAEDIAKRAKNRNMSEEEYFTMFVKPQINKAIEDQFNKMAIERELPKSTVEYVLRGLEDSVIGMVANRLMLTESQQKYRNMADAMTAEGKNPNLQPGLLAEGGRLATGMASDFWLWGGWGKIGAKATQELVEQRIAAVAAERHVTKEVARRLVEEEGKQYMGKGIVEGIMRHIPQSAITMGGAEATTEAVRGIRDREEIGEIIGNTIGAGAGGAMTGTAFGVTGGVMSRVTSQLSGAKKIMGKLAGLEVEAATMYTTEEIQRMANGEDAFSNPLEGLLEANVKLGFIKASANPMETGMKLMEAIKHPVKTAKGMTKPDLGTLNEADVADILESSEGLELIDALTAMRPGRSTTGQREGTISAEEAQRGAEAYRQYMTDPDRPWERKQKVARLLGGMVPPPGREVSAEISGSDGGYTLRTRDIDGQCVRELHFDSLDEAVKAQDGMAYDLTMNETEALAQQIDMYDASQRFIGYLEEEYQRAAMKLRNGEELTDGEKQAVYIRQHSGDLLDIHNKIGDGQELSEEEQRLGDIYKERFGDYVRSGRASEAFTREFEEGAGLPEGAVRQAVDGHSRAEAESIEADGLVEVGNGTWRTATEQRIVDAYHEAMRQHIEEAQAASPNVRPDEYNRSAEPFIGERVMLGDGSDRVDRSNGGNGQFSAETGIYAEPSEETMRRRGQAYDRGAGVAQDQSALPGINYDIKLADARLLTLFPKEDAKLNRIRREIMQAVESGDDVKADELLAQVSQQLTPQQAEAIETYHDLMETQRGVEDSVAQQAADYEEQRRYELEPLTATDGSITPLTLTDGSVVYYKAGDLNNKYGGLIVATGNGEQRQIPTSSVQGIGNKQMASELITAEIDQFAQELEAIYKGIATGQVFIPGQQSDLVIAGRQFIGTVIKSDPVNGVVFQLEDGSQYPMTPADAAKAVADADAIKIQAQLEQEKQAAREAKRSERYQSGIVGYSDGHPDYSAPDSDPKTVADYLLQDVQDDRQRDRILNNIQGEKDLLTQNTQQAWEEYRRAQNALEMADDNQKKAKAIQDMEGARRRIVELQERQKKWGEIRQAIMTQEERTRFENDRAKTIHKHLTESRKSLSIEQQSAEENPLPTGQELLAQYNEQSEAEAAVTALSKETTRQWREELYPQLSDVRQMVSEYQQGLMELSGDELRHLTDVLANLEQQESALVARNKALKQLYGSLGRLYSSRNNASLTPHERKLNQLGREKDRVKKMKLAREVYAGDEIAASILEDDEPHDVYEFVSRNLGYGSINWEGLDRGGHHVRGLQEELGRDKTRSLEKGSDTYGFNAFLAPTGAGSGIDEIVHSIYESQPDGQRYSTEEIKDALLDMLQSARRPTDISHRIENDRIAAAEQAWLANEAAEREQMDAEAQERQNAIEDYQDYLNTLSSELPTDDAESFISGLLADEIAEIEQERMTYEDALRELYTDETETNIDQYGETNIQQESTAPASGRVDKEPQRGTVEEGTGVRQEVVPVKKADKPAHETGDTERPETQPARPGEGTGTVDADRGIPLEAETDDLAAPKGLEERISINDDYTTGESDNGEIYLQTVTIDGQHEVVKVDAPDDKGNYNGSYYEYDGKRFGDLQEVVGYIDGVDRSDGLNRVNRSFGERLEAAKSETNTNPTEAQKAAGNYKKGHLSFGGYDYTIENPKGSVRSGTDQNGRPWSVTMQDTYGYILGKIGVDGDHIDMYINDDADLDTWNGRVFVIDQKNEDGTFDEHKVMYGYSTWADARRAYERNFEPGWWDKHVMQMTGAMKTDFDQWLSDSDHKTKPFADYRRVQMADTVNDPMSDLLATVQERQDNGKTLRTLQKANGEATTPTAEDIALRNVLVEDYLRPAGIKVNTDVEAAEKILADENAAVKAQKLEEEKNAANQKGNTVGNGVGRSLTKQEATELAAAMKSAATPIPEIPLTQENWEIEFGKDGRVTTPVGIVKMGENQMAKLISKKRTSEFGMIKPTLTSPQIVVEVPSNHVGQEVERNTSYLFVRSFTGKDGKKTYFFKSVTVSIDGMEVSVSSHYDRPKRVKEALEKGKLLYRFDGGAQTEQQPADVSVTTPLVTEQDGVSVGKGSENVGTVQENREKNDTRFFKTKDGTAYGFVKDGEIYLDPNIANADTPIHEYSHLWAEALRQANPDEWKNIVGLMKGGREVGSIWEKVRKEYPELATDDEIAEEVLSQYSGKRGRERMEAEYKAAEMAGETDSDEASKARRLLDRIRDALRRFWQKIADFLHIHYTSAEEVADQVMSDLLNSVNPMKEARRYATESGRIEMDAKSDGTFMKAPDGSRSKLSEKQWVTARTKGFKKWIGGDWQQGGEGFEGKLEKNGEPKEKYVQGYMERPRKPGKPKKKDGETMADYLQRLRLWENATKEWPETEAQWKAVVDKHEDKELPDEEAIKAQWEEKYQDDLQQWKTDNGLPADAEPPADEPLPGADTDPLDYMKQMADYRRREAMWKTAPRHEDYVQQAEDELYSKLAERDLKRHPLSHQARLKGVGASLTELRHAVARQKRYDKDTVKAVTDFARQFMTLGFGDHLGRGDIGKLLSAVRNATGSKSVKQSVDKILNTLVDNHLRNLDGYIWKIASVKELRQNAAGVEVQGKLELKGQRMIQAFRKAVEGRSTAEELEERLNEIAGKMTGDPEQATMWEAEYEGVQAALQYRKDIDGSRAELESLRQEYKDAEKEYAKSGRTYEQQQQLLEELETAMMDNRIERIGLYGRLAERLGGLISGSIKGAHEFVERERQRVADIHRMANYDLAGKDMGAFRNENWKRRLNNSSVPRFFLGSLGTFEQMLRQFGSRNPNGEGYLYNHFMRSWMDATDNEWIGVRDAKKELDEKAAEVFGKKKMRWSDLYSMERKMPTVDVEIVDQGEKKTFTLTQGNMLYIYMADKMNDGRMKLRKMGIAEEDVERLKEQIDPRLIQLADWLQDDFLVKKRTEYNKIHERLFGAPMAAIDNYFPLRILSDARIKDEDVGNVQDGDTALPSTATGALIKRTKNALPLDILNGDALSIAIEHVEEMEKWAAFARWNKDINTLLSYTTFRNKVKNMNTIYGNGEQLWQTFRAAAQMAAGTYKPKVKPGGIDKTISNMAKGVTAAKISFRVYTAIKQILSAPAFLNDANLKYFLEDAVTPWQAWKWSMANMPVLEKRWKSRQVGDTRLMDDPTDWKIWQNNVVKLAAQWGMSPNAFVDAVTCSVGAHAIYRTRFDRYRKQGFDEVKAHKKALQDAEIGYNLTQQSSEGAMVSEVQMMRTLAANMMSVFRNSSMAYTRQTVDALRNLKHRTQKGYRDKAINFLEGQLMEEGLDEGQAKVAARAEYRRGLWHDLARVVVSAFLLPIFWNLGSSMPYLLFGDDGDEKEKMAEDAIIKGMLAGPVEGLVGGNIASDLVGLAATHEGISLKGLKNYEINPLPLFSDMQNTLEKVSYDKVAAVEDLVSIVIQSGVGINPHTITDALTAAIDYGRGDMASSKEIALFIMRVMNAPTSSWRNAYIDELGMNAEDAQKLSYQELAERYATYMMQKNTPIFGWMYSDEEEAKRRASYMKKFDEVVKERMGNLGEEEMQRNFDRTDDADEKKLMGKVAAKQSGSEDTERNQDYMALRTYGDLTDDLTLTKAYREHADVAKELKRLKDEHADDEEIERYETEHQQELEVRKRIESFRRAAGKLKKELGTGNDEAVMEQIREKRRELMNELGL